MYYFKYMPVNSIRRGTIRFEAGGLARNTLFALGQSLAVAICLFLSYRLVVAHVGLERFGVWSLLLAGSAMVRIGDVSGGGALARFVAEASRTSDPSRPRDVVHTVILTSLAFNAAIALVLWLGAPSVLPLIVTPSHLAEAHALVPYVVASMVVGALAVAVSSGIDGTQRADQRALVTIVASLVFLGACALLVPSYGVLGFGAAQVLQQTTVLALGWLVLRRHIADLGWLPLRWRRDAFTETSTYALKLNAIGVAGMLFEPLAKFAFNHAGGPALVALYELAARLVVQVRALTVSAATPLVPAFARVSVADPNFKRMLERATRIAAFAAVGTTIATLVGAPVMSLIVLGHLSPELLAMNSALTAAWSINILVVPIYFAAQGVGVLRWNFVSHAAIALSTVFGVFLLVPPFGPAGLIAAIVAGVILSMIIVLFGNAHALGVVGVVRGLWRELLGASALIVLLSSIAYAVATLSAG
ncbi:lipopolysaccharide biosynthesis protein [Mesorhizobium shangrilense]|uniref:Membrane protein involved in the export of O-antigen and teichoic acid n=1 Tax=Mesorhizobium shangrilense TaxID=460060 RepID=A0ABV2DDG0_9HYPH